MTKLHGNYFLDFLLTVAICHQHFTELNLVSKIVAIQKRYRTLDNDDVRLESLKICNEETSSSQKLRRKMS